MICERISKDAPLWCARSYARTILANYDATCGYRQHKDASTPV
jgi:hypothetical protein